MEFFNEIAADEVEPACAGGKAACRNTRPEPFTTAARGQLTLSKAPKSVVWVLTARQPSITFRLKARNTPGRPEAAMARAVRRLSTPSVRGCSMGSWAPVSTTGIGMPSTIKVSTEAV